MEIWLPIALAAGCLQTARNGLARSLAGKISPALSSWSRFTFNLPFSTVLVVALFALQGVLQLNGRFFAFCLATATTQLLGNVALVAAFDHANFAQSIVLHKLEVVVTAIIGVLLFSEMPSSYGWVGIVVSTVGVLVMNLGRDAGPEGWRRAFHLDAGSLLALAAAFLLTFAAFLLKEANAELVVLNPRVGTDRFEVAAQTLFHTTWIEVLILSAWLSLRSPHEFVKVRAHWKRMLGIGAAGFAGSLGWFWSFSLTLAAYVKAVGQIEAVLAVVLAVVVWKEREVWRQLPGVVMVVGGILMLVLV